ncbi:hypothetical protein FJT64_021761 [Amphibalanus amphitrite]|uniref:Uncharacterized protein n=1 Tax=Amphibalanus amphitrite TaxID=1232801 RepID=A0A6A4WWL8_AMPAM|nr:hypothetical protein FJT64_021761 [Amphibalanus amphitrite]
MVLRPVHLVVSVLRLRANQVPFCKHGTISYPLKDACRARNLPCDIHARADKVLRFNEFCNWLESGFTMADELWKSFRLSRSGEGADTTEAGQDDLWEVIENFVVGQAVDAAADRHNGGQHERRTDDDDESDADEIDVTMRHVLNCAVALTAGCCPPPVNVPKTFADRVSRVLRSFTYRCRESDRENPLPESTPGYMQMAFPEVFRSGDADPYQDRKLQTSLKHKVAEIERDLRVEDPTLESDASRVTLETRVSAAWRDCQQEYVRHIGRCYTNWNAGLTKDGERTFDFAYDRKTTVCRASMAVQLDDALSTGDFAAIDELYVRVINGTLRHTGHSGRGDAPSAKDGCAVRRQVVDKAATEAARSADGRAKQSRGDGSVEYALKYAMKPVAPIRTTGDMLLSAMERREASDNVDIGVVQKMYNQAAASMCQSIFQAVHKNWQLPLLQKNLDVKRFSMSGCRVVKPANAADNPVYVYADSVERFNARLGNNIRHGNIPLADIQRKMS